MRIISFTEMWPKLKLDEFTTFRFSRRDKDYQVGEKLQVWYRQRSPKRKFLFNAEIIGKDVRSIKAANGEPNFKDEEAQVDGFADRFDMWIWLLKAHDPHRFAEPINKLTLRKIPLSPGERVRKEQRDGNRL